jgi:hypothetical protein
VRRSEATGVAAVGGALVVAGATWLIGPYVLVAAGVVLLVVALFVLNVEG